MFITFVHNMLIKPRVRIVMYEDTGTYFNISVAHCSTVCEDIAFDLRALADYFGCDASYLKTCEALTGRYTGKKYGTFHDGMVSAGFATPVAKNLSMETVAQHWFRLSNKAKRTIDANLTECRIRLLREV